MKLVTSVVATCGLLALVAGIYAATAAIYGVMTILSWRRKPGPTAWRGANHAQAPG